MNLLDEFCPNPACHTSGEVGGGNIVIHSRKEERYKCKCCGKTFSARRGTAAFGLKKPVELFVLVVTLLAYGCPRQAIVAAFELDERTVAEWHDRAGQHSQAVHEHLVGGAQLDLQQVQADELRVKCQGGVLWMAMALMVSTRLWLGGVVSHKRDKHLIRALLDQVRQVALCRPLLIAVDGLGSYVSAIQRSFRTPVPSGGRPRLVAWPQVLIAQVIKRRSAGTLTIERRVRQGCAAVAHRLITLSQGAGGINTAYIERLNGTFRQRMGCLVRRSRALPATAARVKAGMYLAGTVYNFCTWHHSLRQVLWVGRHGLRRWVDRTPAMAAGLTAHRWSVAELLAYKVPTRYLPPKRRGRRPRTFACGCPAP